MGLKRRNPARSRLLTAPEVLAVMAASPAPAANTEAKPAEAPKVEQAVEAPAPRKISGDERHQMIAKAAYRYAERAHFRSDPLHNWLLAEREIDAELARVAS
jgi:hypothetical protein